MSSGINAAVSNTLVQEKSRRLQNLLPEAGEDESDTWQGGALLLVDYGTD